MPYRVYDIAKILGIESKEVLVKAKELSIAAAKVPSSSLDIISGEKLLVELMRGRTDSEIAASRDKLRKLNERQLGEKLGFIQLTRPSSTLSVKPKVPTMPLITLPSDAPVITMRSPIIVRALADALKQRPFAIIAELMKRKVMAMPSQTVDEKIAAQVCANYGYKFEAEKHAESGGVVHPQVEKERPGMATKPPSPLEKQAEAGKVPLASSSFDNRSKSATKGEEANVPTYVVDGTNVIRNFRKYGKRSLGCLLTLLVEMKTRGFNFKCYFDASTPYDFPRNKRNSSGQNKAQPGDFYISDTEKIYHALVLLLPNRFVEAPAGSEADDFFIPYAEENKLPIISNDGFIKYKSKHPWLSDSGRCIKGMVDDEKLRVPPMNIKCDLREDIIQMAKEVMEI